MKAAVVLLLALAALCRVHAEDTRFHVAFGIFAPPTDGPPPKLAEETLTIPRRLRETGFRWGFAIAPDQAGDYTWRAVFYLPKPPRSVAHEAKRRATSPNIAELPVRHATDAGAFVMSFDDGDPLGTWKIEVFIDEKLARTISFQVVADQ